MRKNRANLMKRYTVAIVAVSTALPTVAPAVPVFADEEDETVTADGGIGGEDNEKAEMADDKSSATDESSKANEADESGKDETDSNTDETDGTNEISKNDKADKDNEDDIFADGGLEDNEQHKSAQPDEIVKEEGIKEDAKLEDEAEEKEDLIDNLDLPAKAFTDYPKFGSAEYVAWLVEASEEDIKGWYDAAVLYLNADKATSSNAEKADKNILSFDTDAFWAWVYEDAAEMKDGEWFYDMDAILSWMVDAGYEDARAFCHSPPLFRILP